MRIRGLVLAAALLAAAPALPDDPARRDFDPDPSRPSALAEGAFAVETAAPQARGTAHAELLLDYAHGLLSVKTGDTRTGYLLGDRLSLHLLGSYALGPIELAADLPFALYQSSDLNLLTSRGITGDLVAPIGATALGDLRLLAKAPLFRHALPFDLAVALELRLPTGDGQAFYSDKLAAQPFVLLGRGLGSVRLDGSVGYLFRRPGQYLQLVAHDAFTYGLAATLPLPNFRNVTWRAIVDLAGQIPRGLLGGGDRYRAPLSVRGGVRVRVWRGLAVDFGVGTGLAGVGDAGYGRESIRVFAGLRWEHIVPEGKPGDRDGDGVPDAEDRCPDEPGPADLEGCPDRDGDGIPDIDDKCPDTPGLAKYDGCPPPPQKPEVEVEAGRLILKGAINFDTGRDTVRPQSARVLDEVAKTLNAHPELKRIRIEGHTDNQGGRAYNQDLSSRRAHAVVRGLVQRGIAPERLEAQGYGFDLPITSNATALGRAKNRRVEFTILEPGPRR